MVRAIVPGTGMDTSAGSDLLHNPWPPRPSQPGGAFPDGTEKYRVGLWMTLDVGCFMG